MANASLQPENGRDVLETSQVYVTKVGGDNAGKLKRNAGIIRDRLRKGRSQIVAVSAIRSSDPRSEEFRHPAVQDLDADGDVKPGFNTTSHLNAIAARLQSGSAGDREEAADMAQRIGTFTAAAVEDEVSRDGEITDPGASGEFRALIHSLIEDPQNPNSLMHVIRTARPEEIRQVGEDWLRTTDREVTSITGQGEVLARELTGSYLRARHIMPGTLDLASDYPGIYEAMDHGAQSLAVKKVHDAARGALGRLFQTYRVMVAGGYVPYLGSERGYSDKTGALLARTASKFSGDVAYLIEKGTPIMSADPRKVKDARPVPRMTYFLAKELFGSVRGADGGAIHPEALDMLSSDGIPIVVLNPQEEPTDGNTTLIHHFAPAPNGVEIVASKRVPFAIQISTGTMIGRGGFEADITQWFHDRGVSIQHIATSEGSISYTFDDGKSSGDLVSALRQHIKDRYGTNGTEIVQATENLSALYCLGNNMQRPGQAAKATFALDMAGVNIHMITQGLNQSVMAFLVNREEAAKGVLALHDIFITLPDHVYQGIMEETHGNTAQAVESHRKLLSS